MTPKAITLFKVLLNRYHKDPPQNALKLLPADQAEAVNKEETQSQDLAPVLAAPEELIKKVHYSWLKPFIEGQPKSLASLYLSALPKEQSAKLLPLFQTAKLETLSPPLKAFLLQKTYRSLFDHQVTLPPYLPSSPLNTLLHCSKPELLTLIDYFGLYDLGEAIRHIVDKRYIKQLYSCLTPRKQEFLRTTLYQKERLVSTPLDLTQWKGDCNEIKQIVHRRGMLRLGIALSEQHPDLIWHISRILDTGRAAILNSCIAKEKKIPGVVPALTQQLLHLMNFLKIKPSV